MSLAGSTVALRRNVTMVRDLYFVFYIFVFFIFFIFYILQFIFLFVLQNQFWKIVVARGRALYMFLDAPVLS